VQDGDTLGSQARAAASRGQDRRKPSPRPTGISHHHLAILAVRPDEQGQGTGTALLCAYHQMLDSGLGVPAYLEASDLRTRRIYLRHGYADHGLPIHLPGGPFMYPMVRERHYGSPRQARPTTDDAA
jgi:GNAT superfamily N-acetyltransferase